MFIANIKYRNLPTVSIRSSIHNQEKKIWEIIIITKVELLRFFVKFSQIILWGIVCRSVLRIYKWKLGVKGSIRYFSIYWFCNLKGMLSYACCHIYSSLASFYKNKWFRIINFVNPFHPYGGIFFVLNTNNTLLPSLGHDFPSLLPLLVSRNLINWLYPFLFSLACVCLFKKSWFKIELVLRHLSGHWIAVWRRFLGFWGNALLWTFINLYDTYVSKWHLTG